MVELWVLQATLVMCSRQGEKGLIAAGEVEH
jgi:hypothetical protein